MILKIFWFGAFIFASGGIAYICNAHWVGFALTVIFTLLFLALMIVPWCREIKEKKKEVIIVEFIAGLVAAGIIGTIFWFSAPLKIKGDFSEHKCVMTIVRSDGSKYTCNVSANGGKEKEPLSFKFNYYCSDHYGLRGTGSAKGDKEEDSYGHDKSDAWIAATDVVESKLKSPSTADFCRSSDATITRSGNTWTISGYVDAQNSFGATIRNNFTVKVTFTSKNNYTIDQCNIYAR